MLDCDVLIFVLEGTLFITQNGKDITVGPGEALLMAKGLEHCGTRASRGRLSYLWVHFSVSSPWDLSPGDDHICHIPEHFALQSPVRIRQLFELMMSYPQSERKNSMAMAVCALRLLLMELTEQADSPGPQTGALVHDISLWVRNNCHRRLTVADIAARFHYSPDYISSRFRRETGEKLSFFLNTCRIERAKCLLASKSVSIRETACSCGFSDEKYFARAFRKATGMTPSEYRSK